MADSIKDLQATNPAYPPMSAQVVPINEAEEAMRQLRIHPRKELDSLGHLRVEKTRIKPLEDKATKAGGNADVEAAILVPDQSLNSPKFKDTEYIAVKKLRFDTDTDDDRTLAPFAHEIKLLNDLSHPNVVKIVGFVEDVEEGIGWMLFTWEKNGNLREFVRSANWELPERMSLIDDVTKGIGYLHGRTPPICHGDLKSLNILVNSKNQAIITDFGSARTVDSATKTTFKGVDTAAVVDSRHRIATTTPPMNSLTAELAESGDFITMTGPAWTIRWAAPELLEGELPSLPSDIWALGWICWEAVTGNFPFDEDNDFAIVLRITTGDLPAVGDNAQLKQVKTLCSLMGECWRLNANERPTAIRCQQIISVMHQVIPSGSRGNGLVTTRSSGLLRALGKIQLRNGLMQEAQKCFQESFEVAELVKDRLGKARALEALGDADYVQSEYSKAEESYIQARDIYSQIGDRAGVAHSVKGLGDVYHLQSEHSKAQESYIQARDIYSKIGDQLGFANSVKGLGDVYYMRNEYYKAEESCIQARDTYSQIGNQLGFANSVRGLGEVYRMQNEWSKAEESYLQARDAYSEIGDQLGVANSVEGLGDVYLVRKEYRKAEESYIQAINSFSQIGNRLGSANATQGLGRTYSALGQYANAEKSYLEAQAVYRQIGDMLSLANNLWYLGWMCGRQAQYAEAERFVCEASTIYGNLNMNSDVEDCDTFLKRVRELIPA